MIKGSVELEFDIHYYISYYDHFEIIFELAWCRVCA